MDCLRLRRATIRLSSLSSPNISGIASNRAGIEPAPFMPYAGDMSHADNPMRSLPSVNAVLEAEPLPGLQARFAQEQLTAAVRAELDAVRSELRESANGPPPDAAALAARLAQRPERQPTPNLLPGINPAGIRLCP